MTPCLAKIEKITLLCFYFFAAKVDFAFAFFKAERVTKHPFWLLISEKLKWKQKIRNRNSYETDPEFLKSFKMKASLLPITGEKLDGRTFDVPNILPVVSTG